MLVDSVLKIFRTASDKYVKSMRPFVARVNELEPGMQALDEQALSALSTDWRQRLDRGEALDDLLPEIFAGVREVAVRVLATAQHREMMDSALSWFEIAPDVALDVMRHGQTLAQLTARLIASPCVGRCHPGISHALSGNGKLNPCQRSASPSPCSAAPRSWL